MKRGFFLVLQFLARSCLVARDDRAKILPLLWQKLAETKIQGTAVPLRTVCPCRLEKIGFSRLVCHFFCLFTSPSDLFGSSNSCPLLLFPHSDPSALPTPSHPHSDLRSLSHNFRSPFPLLSLSLSVSLPLVSLSHSLWSVSLTHSLAPSHPLVIWSPVGRLLQQSPGW